MSAKARPTTSSATSCCASRSPSARWPARSPSALVATGLANRAGPQEPRQQADRGEQRPAPLPGLDLDVGAGVAVDLPGDVVGAAGEGRSWPWRAGAPSSALPFDCCRRAQLAARAAAASRHRGKSPASAEPLVAVGIGVDDRVAAALALGAQLGANRSARKRAATGRADRLARSAAASVQPSSVGAAAATASMARSRAASSAAQTSRDGWAKRAQTETSAGLRAAFSARKSASLSTAYLAASPSCSK